jgi:hypothetical protein
MARTRQQPDRDPDDTERTDTGSFSGRATVELEAGRTRQDEDLEQTEGQPETADDEGANTDDETPEQPIEPTPFPADDDPNVTREHRPAERQPDPAAAEPEASTLERR